MSFRGRRRARKETGGGGGEGRLGIEKINRNSSTESKPIFGIRKTNYSILLDHMRVWKNGDLQRT